MCPSRTPGSLVERELAAVRLTEGLTRPNLHRRRYLHAAASMEALSPLKVLSRGYSMVTGETGVIKSVEELHRGDLVTITMRDGESTCTVDQVIRKERKK